MSATTPHYEIVSGRSLDEMIQTADHLRANGVRSASVYGYGSMYSVAVHPHEAERARALFPEAFVGR